MLPRFSALAGIASACILAGSFTALAQNTILNVSYDVSRELYKELNPAFAEMTPGRLGLSRSIVARLYTFGRPSASRAA